MITHSMKIRRHLRSARAAAMTSEERLLELQAAERRIAQGGDRPEPDADGAPDHVPGSRADAH